MFDFLNQLEQNSIHEVSNENWEEILDTIFLDIISKHRACIALSSNTEKLNSNDKKGIYSALIIYRFSKFIDQNTHDLVNNINKDIFNRLFNHYHQKDNKSRCDFYHVGKKNKIDIDLLIYPLHQSLDKKALLILEHRTDQSILDQICREIAKILS